MRIIDWNDYAAPSGDEPLAVTVGVFDGVHIGHQALIRRICASSYTPAVITFRQNPRRILSPAGFTGDILSLDQKLAALEAYGARLAVLIDFSGDFSRMNGRDFIGRLLSGRPVRFVAVGDNFRCGRGLDTGVGEIREIAESRGVEMWAAGPVLYEGLPVSSSRIRQALAAGRRDEAEKLLGRPLVNPPWLKESCSESGAVQ